MRFFVVECGKSGKTITIEYNSLEEANKEAEKIWNELPETSKSYLHVYVSAVSDESNSSEYEIIEGVFDSERCDRLKIERLVAEYIEKKPGLSSDESCDLLYEINDLLNDAWYNQKIPAEFFMTTHARVYSQ